MKIDIGAHFKSTRAAKGAYAEIALAKALRANGYKVKRLHNAGHDLEVTKDDKTLRIEVKYATQGKDGKYRATCFKNDGSQNHKHSDIIVMLCHSQFTGGELTPFIIPVSVQGDKHHIAITSNPKTYTGFYSAYRGAWGLLQ